MQNTKKLEIAPYKLAIQSLVMIIGYLREHASDYSNPETHDKVLIEALNRAIELIKQLKMTEKLPFLDTERQICFELMFLTEEADISKATEQSLSECECDLAKYIQSDETLQCEFLSVLSYLSKNITDTSVSDELIERVMSYTAVYDNEKEQLHDFLVDAEGYSITYNSTTVLL